MYLRAGSRRGGSGGAESDGGGAAYGRGGWLGCMSRQGPADLGIPLDGVQGHEQLVEGRQPATEQPQNHRQNALGIDSWHPATQQKFKFLLRDAMSGMVASLPLDSMKDAQHIHSLTQLVATRACPGR